MAKDKGAEGGSELRKKAEEAVSALGAAPTEPQELLDQLHELRVYQVELEMQNDELRKTQTELAAAKDRYFELYDQAPVGYASLNDKGIILEINHAGAMLLGFAQGPMVGLPINRFIADEDQDAFYLHRQALLLGGKEQLIECRGVAADQSILWLQIAVRAMQNGQGGRIFRAAMLDVTAQKMAAQKTLELQAQVAQSQKLDAIGRLAGGVAHDFNNMLGVILGKAELVLGGPPLPSALHQNIVDIQKAALRSAALTRQLLGFARHQPIQPVAVDLSSAIDDMLDILRSLVGESIKVVWSPRPDLWPVCIDPSQLDQILTNLCTNARDAMGGPGSVVIEVEHCELSEGDARAGGGIPPGAYGVLKVRDNGQGIAKDLLDKIFEPFFTSKPLGSGTGLGLALVQGIVKQNKGFINVASKLGQGSTFEIFLPRFAGKVLPQSPTAKPVASGQSSACILLAEDEPDLRAIVAETLALWGYKVLSAETSAEALRLAQGHLGEIQLLLSDVKMPGMSGPALAKEALRLNPLLKVLYMSGYADEELSSQGLLIEGTHFIQKPFQLDHLAAKIKVVLGA